MSAIKQKMQEYLDNGAQLGWLLDPQNKTIYIYRADRPVEILSNVTTDSAEPLVKKFTINLTEIW